MQTVCIAIAVLLPYLYLVVYMWMMMEGVVLYVKLVKVFTANHKLYIAFFTIASYGKFHDCMHVHSLFGECMHIGVPLIYMILVVPLGFLVNTEHIVGSHYGRRNENGDLEW